MQSRETEGSLNFIKAEQTIMLTKMRNLSKVEEKWPHCIQNATIFCVISSLMLCKLKELGLQAEGK